MTTNTTDNLGTSVDLNETMHAASMRTINHENNVFNVTISPLLETRGAAKANRKWRCKHVHPFGTFVLVGNFQWKFLENFRKIWINFRKFPEIFRTKFPDSQPYGLPIWWMYLKPRSRIYDWRFSVWRFWPWTLTLTSQKLIATFCSTAKFHEVGLYISRQSQQTSQTDGRTQKKLFINLQSYAHTVSGKNVAHRL